MASSSMVFVCLCMLSGAVTYDPDIVMYSSIATRPPGEGVSEVPVSCTLVAGKVHKIVAHICRGSVYHTVYTLHKFPSENMSPPIVTTALSCDMVADQVCWSSVWQTCSGDLWSLGGSPGDWDLREWDFSFRALSTTHCY